VRANRDTGEPHGQPAVGSNARLADHRRTRDNGSSASASDLCDDVAGEGPPVRPALAGDDHRSLELSRSKPSRSRTRSARAP
jgi:hypothetical protein